MTARTARTARLAVLRDEIRRRLWAREREGNERDFDQMVEEIARHQYEAEPHPS